MHGGQNPVANATVTLYAAGDEGIFIYPISEELGPFGFSLPVVVATTTTDASGNYNIDSFTCPEVETSPDPYDPAYGSPETYIVATGGDSGSGTNSAIAMMAAIGPCDQIQNSTVVNINELTTIAAEWALQQFADSSGQDISAPLLDLGGLANAYVTIANLVEQDPSDLSVSGGPSSFLPTAAQCSSMSAPVNCDGLKRLDTLADIIAACVNSSGPTSTACATLFCDATPGDTYSGTCSGTPTITDTLQASYSIAQNPTNNVADLLALAMPNAPFEPTLGSTPDGWEIALNYAPSGAAFHNSSSLALDGSGNVFVTNEKDSNSVSEVTVAGGYNIGLNFAPAGANFDIPDALAVDGSGNVFAANQAGSVSELTAASSYATGSNFSPSAAMFSFPTSPALDNSGNIFVANQGNNSVSELTAASSYATGSNFDNTTGAAFSAPISLALDTSANVFVANNTGNSVSELTSASSYATGFNYAPAGATFNGPRALALDSSANVFVANAGGNSVSELTASSSYATGLHFDPTGAVFNDPVALSVDGSNDVFVANNNGNSVSELTSGSSYATGFNFAAPGADFNDPISLGVDGSGNVFVANNGGNSVSQLIGLAVPVMTPLQDQMEAFSIDAGGAGRAGDAILVFLCLMTFWYGRKFILASRKRAAWSRS